ncbi:MAG: NAD(P)H-dependent oxidoreductase subunit E [Deltaproteobacteria bacterium]|nr:NAD(P)H-dependent oxidoreductase subunit E [Deltaproteobacteria bacterium]
MVLLGHGSREDSANREFLAAAEGFAQKHPAWRVVPAFVEMARPSLPEALASLAKEGAHPPVVVLPLFLFLAGHVKNDIGLALDGLEKHGPSSGARPWLAARELGAEPALTELAWRRAQDAAPQAFTPEAAPHTAVVVVGRGSSDPDANGEFHKAARLMTEGRGLGWTLPAYMGITRPLAPEVMDMAARLRPRRLVVVPYMLFGGVLVERLREQAQAFAQRHPWIQVTVAEPLGVNEALLGVLTQRVEGALAGTAVLPCGSCQYREPLPGKAREAGGLKALLWSLRHGAAHQALAGQARHAHRPLNRHVLVCGNADCASRGSLRLLRALRDKIKSLGKGREILVTRAGCMGRCGEGPTVAVYPDGVWYRGVSEQDAGTLVEEHLVGDRLVGRLVDQVMG